jgi:hypothetical protein
VSILALAPEGNILERVGFNINNLDLPAALNQIRNDLHPGQLAFVEQYNYRNTWH